MVYRSTFEMLALAAVLMMTVGGAKAEDKKFPNWKGEWTTITPRMPGQQLRFDPSKPYGVRQEAPLTEEYKKIHEENLAETALGRQGLFLGHASCFPAGMPTMMSAGTHEYIITPETTYISAGTDLRRIFTDGRPWPEELEPTFQGFSIGKWIDEDGDGVYDVLEVETRGPFKGPRVYDASGLPLHFDNDSTFKERIFVDKNNPNVLHDVITVIDRALTRPWTADKTYRKGTAKYPNWSRETCLEGNAYVTIGKEYYLVTGDGYLMPTTKGQLPPDSRYFPQMQK
ncbi:MAG: hypothetical protein QOI12_3803 [Alphaproteobacteria bacterium]|nr:hypothetical protein [Alphaproteobacteria bacterium]